MFRFARWGSRRRHRVAAPIVPAHRYIKGLGALAASVVAFLAAALEAQATCRGRNFVDRMSVSVSGTVRATSTNGETYNNIRADSFDADYSITLCGDGALHGVIVHLGKCSGHDRGGCTADPIMYQEFPSARSLSKKTPTFTFAPPLDSGAGQSILKTCNAHADQQKGGANDMEIFPGLFSVTLGVTTARDPGSLGGEHHYNATGPVGIADQRPLAEYSKTEPGTLTLRILCAPLPAPIKAPPKITGAQLGVTAYGDTCPKPAGATVMINAEAPRPVFYKIERGNRTTTTDDWIRGEIKLQKAPDGRQRPFLTAQHNLPALDPGTRMFRLWIDGWGKTPWRTVEVDCPPFKVTSAWLKYEVEDQDTCPRKVVETATFHTNRPGRVNYEIKHHGGLVVSKGKVKAERQGGKYVATAVRKLTIGQVDAQFMADVKKSPANSGWVPLKIDCLEALSGKVTLKSLGATSCQGEALVAIHTSGAGELPYELECGPGRSWQRSVAAPDNKIGVDKVQFDVKNNELVTCALRTRIGGKLKSLDGASRRFQCHRPTGASGSSDFVPETRPDDPPPVGRRLAGDFSFVDNGGRRCPRQGKALINFTTNEPGNIHWSLDCTNGSFSGVAQAVKGTKGYVAPALATFGIDKTTQVNCALKTVAPGKARVHNLRGHLFQCVRSTGVSGSDDLAPDSRPDPTGPRPPRIVADPPRVCPPNTVGRWPNCRPRPCPKGTVGTYPNCRRVDPRRCPRGTVGRPPNCRPRPCPKGTVGAYPNCRRVVPPKCPRGMVGRPPNCRPRPCPPGQARVRGRCIKPAG